MKYVKQLMIILFITFLGEILAKILPFTIPAGVYGMIIMLTALVSGVLKLDMVEDTADFLLTIMPVLFIPSCVGIINVWDKIEGNVVAILVISLVSTVIVMGITGLVAQAIMKRKEKKDD